MVPQQRLQQMIYGALLALVMLEQAVNADQVNIAHLATISATPKLIYGGYDYKKENAVDGRIDTSPRIGNSIDNCGCCYVSFERSSDLYFNARFAGHYHVQTIIIIGRQYNLMSSQSLSNISVNLDGVAVNHVYNGTNTAIVTPTSASVQNIRVTQHQDRDMSHLLVICEIYVMAKVINIAKSASLTASPALVYDGKSYNKSQAVDGRFGEGTVTCGCCYSSDREQSPFLQVDLMQPYNVFRIVIEGRKEQNRECGDDFYSNTCSTPCPPNCAAACDSITGSCVGGCESGFHGDYCNISCSEGTFGPNCVSQCHCKYNAPCNTTSGYCENGCVAGWTGFNCSQVCPDGTYGENCAHTCRCMNYTACDKSMGNCSDGCDYGWTGFDCSNNINLLRRIKENINTSMSSVDGGLNSSLAVDGRYDLISTFDGCRCCSLTMKIIGSWWQLDLGKPYLVQDIYVIGRHIGYLQQSSDLKAVITNTTTGTITGAPLDNQPLGQTLYNYSFVLPRVFQYLTVSKQTGVDFSKIAVCEVILIEGVCSEHPGKSFGDKCSRACHCADGNPCDKVNGKCQRPGCLPGWMGDSCDEACNGRKFGMNCSSVCHCYNGTSCKKDSGKCLQYMDMCEAGWRSDNCSVSDIGPGFARMGNDARQRVVNKFFKFETIERKD